MAMTLKDWGEEMFGFSSASIAPSSASNDGVLEMARGREREEYHQAWQVAIDAYGLNVDYEYWDEVSVVSYYVEEYNVGMYALYYIACYAPIAWLKENKDRLLSNLSCFPPNAKACLMPYASSQSITTRDTIKKDILRLMHKYTYI